MVSVRLDSFQQLITTLRDVRLNSGISQSELAMRTHIPRLWINQLEQGKLDNPGIQRILTICNELEIPITLTYPSKTVERFQELQDLFVPVLPEPKQSPHDLPDDAEVASALRRTMLRLDHHPTQ